MSETSSAQNTRVPPAGETDFCGPTVDVAPASDSRIAVAGDVVTLSEVTTTNPDLASILAPLDAPERADCIDEVLRLGTRGLTAVVLDGTVDRADARIRHAVDAALARIENVTGRIVADASAAMQDHLDPDRRTSLMGRARDELARAQAELISQLDLDTTSSASSRLVGELEALIGPSGRLPEILGAMLDPAAEDSNLGRLRSTLEAGIAELRDLIVFQQGKAVGVEEEAAVGTAKGIRFEEIVEQRLREIARRIGSCVVDATGSVTGQRSASSKVGDLVLDAGRHRIVIEVKNTASLTLNGKSGILTELDAAIENRRADYAICVSANDAFPTEVGSFGVYDNRILCVDDGDGTLLEVAVRWALAQCELAERGGSEVDVAAIGATVDRIRQQTARLSGIKRTLTGLKESVDRVYGEIGAMQSELRQQFDQLDVHLDRGDQPGLRVVGDA